MGTPTEVFINELLYKTNSRQLKINFSPKTLKIIPKALGSKPTMLLTKIKYFRANETDKIHIQCSYHQILTQNLTISTLKPSKIKNSHKPQ